MLFPVNFDQEPDVEVRGTHAIDYNQNSLNVLSELWNSSSTKKLNCDETGLPSADYKFPWQKIVEEELLKDMSDEEMNYYNYRKYQLLSAENDNEEIDKTDGRGRGKRTHQKNSHQIGNDPNIVYDFTNPLCVPCGFSAGK